MTSDGPTPWKKYAASLLVVGGGFGALYLVELRNFLLFHSIVEMFSILVAFAVFIIAWNARADLESSFIVILGISYLFVGGLDLLHTLAYKGMGIFPGAGADLPTQLWVFSRYIEAGSLLVAGAVGVAVNEWSSVEAEWNTRTMLALVTGYAVVVGVGLNAIFIFDVFPRAYVQGSGLTTFKVVSEYVVVTLFAAGLGLLFRQREIFDRRVFHLVAASILLTMVAELAFTFYVDVYGISNTVGHFFKLGSFYLVYLAVVKTGIKEPQKTLYRALAQREAEARTFEKAADYSGHAILITDRDGHIQYVNDAWERTTGYTAAEALGETPRLLKSGKHDEAFYEELWETILAGNVWEGELVNERKNGDRFVIYQTIAPIFDEDGEIQGFVGINDEITEQKAYEKRLESHLQESVQQLKVLARVLRHNIRNDMSVVLGNAEMIREQTADDDVAEMAALIQRSSQKLLTKSEKQRAIVQLLLEPSAETPIDLSDLVTNVVERLEAQHPRAELSVDVPPDVQVTTLPEIGQAIEEVVANAIVHNDREVPEVTIGARLQSDAVEVRIEDDGPGIPPVERDVITGATEIDALLHSSGMGLWLVNHIVTQAGGAIRFEDAEPRGSVVTLVVPRDRVERDGRLAESTET